MIPDNTHTKYLPCKNSKRNRIQKEGFFEEIESNRKLKFGSVIELKKTKKLFHEGYGKGKGFIGNRQNPIPCLRET